MLFKFHMILNVLLMLVFVGCSENSSSPYTEKYITGIVDPIHADIADPQERWDAYSLDNYMFSYASSCFCIWGGKEFKVVVRNGILIDVFDPDGVVRVDTSNYTRFRTINQLFEFTNNIHPDSVAFFRHEYDSTYGYPSNVFVDYNYQIADEEFGFWVHTVEEVIKFN